jgi:hypothetical protein
MGYNGGYGPPPASAPPASNNVTDEGIDVTDGGVVITDGGT